MTSDQTLWEEIHQQPDRLEAVIEGNRRQVSRIGALIDGSDVGWVLIAARRTSDNAARYAQYVWGARNGLAVASAAPSLFGGYHRPPLLDGALVVGISQSGQSPDLVGVLEEAKKAPADAGHHQRPRLAAGFRRRRGARPVCRRRERWRPQRPTPVSSPWWRCSPRRWPSPTPVRVWPAFPIRRRRRWA